MAIERDFRKLTPATQAELRRIAVAMVRAGKTRIEAAATVGVNRRFVGQWVKAAAQSGEAALAGGRQGRPRSNRLRREPHGQAAASAQTGVVLGPVGHPVPLLGDVMATGCFGFERHGGDPSVREGAAFLRRPAPDANRPDPCNKVPTTSLPDGV